MPNGSRLMCILQGPRRKFSSRGGGGSLKDKQVKMSQRGDGGGGGGWGYAPRKLLILTPLKCREIHSKLINEILKYKLSVLKKRYRLTKWYSPLKN